MKASIGKYALEVSVEKYTPSKAQSILNKNNTINRKLREGVAEKYAADMRAGRWTTCLDPVAFYDDGMLANGQHRLWAIIEADTPQEFVTVRGVPKDAGLNIDTQLGRTLMDNAKISGENVNLSHRLIAACRAIEGPRKNKSVAWSFRQNLELVERHRAAAEWALAHGPYQRGLGLSVVYAAMARAWYYEEDKDRLEQFGRVLNKGFALEGEADSAAIAIRNYLMSMPSSTAVPYEELFFKIQNAIWYFMKHRKLMLIKKTDDERYPLKKGHGR